MEQIVRYRRQLSFLILFAGISLITGIIYAGANYDVEYELVIPQVVCLLLLFAIYFKVRNIYRLVNQTLKQIEEANLPENITLEQVMNPQPETTEQQIQENKERFNHLVEQFQKLQNPEEIAQSILSRMAKEFQIVQGLFYQYDPKTDTFIPIAEYAYYGQEKPSAFKIGEGLNGQAVRDRKVILISELPEDYRKIVSGLGNREPKFLLIIPIAYNEKVVALTELALFKNLTTDQISILEKIFNQLSRSFEK